MQQKLYMRIMPNEYLILAIVILFVNIANGHLNDQHNRPNTELIQQRAGYDIRILCSLTDLLYRYKLDEIKIHWYFKQCNDDFGSKVTCKDFIEDEWTHLPCEQNFCNSELLLRNVTEKYSGLYKCTINPYTLVSNNTLDIQLVRIYQLEVKNSSYAEPQILDTDPIHKSAQIGGQVVFQCRVQSEVQPSIKWFRRITDATLSYAGDENFNIPSVKYKGYTYGLLTHASEKLISKDIYLSKLILSQLRIEDEGYYACVAISYHGHKIREAYLQIYPNEEAEYWQDYDMKTETLNGTDPIEFWLLFLIPLALAMLPLIFWLSYLFAKNCGNNKNNTRLDALDAYSNKELVTKHYIRTV